MISSFSKIRFNFFSLLLLLVFVAVSCGTDEEATIIDVENLADSSIENLQSSVIGKKHCVEFVFPITIAFIDSTTAEVTDYDNLHETIVEWFTTNDVEKTRENKPSLIYPIEVLNLDGEIIQVNTKEELKSLKSECPREGKCKDGKKGKGHACFELVFPISVIIGEETLDFEDRESLKEAIKAYKEIAEEDAERPELIFPIAVLYDDGNTVEVESKEALKELKEDCQDN